MQTIRINTRTKCQWQRYNIPALTAYAHVERDCIQRRTLRRACQPCRRRGSVHNPQPFLMPWNLSAMPFGKLLLRNSLNVEFVNA